MGYPTSTGAKTAPNRAAQDERAAALVGDRGRRAAELRAVTLKDAADAGVIELQARTVTAAPTAAEHNALVADIKAIAAVLTRLGAKFSGL